MAGGQLRPRCDDFYIEDSLRIERGPSTNSTQVSEFEYDRHDGLPIIRAAHTTITSSDGSTETLDMTITERQFGPVPEEAFDPERFLDGPQVREAFEPTPFSDQPNRLMRWTWLPFAVGTLCLMVGGRSHGHALQINQSKEVAFDRLAIDYETSQKTDTLL